MVWGMGVAGEAEALEAWEVAPDDKHRSFRYPESPDPTIPLGCLELIFFYLTEKTYLELFIDFSAVKKKNEVLF